MNNHPVDSSKKDQKRDPNLAAAEIAMKRAAAKARQKARQTGGGESPAKGSADGWGRCGVEEWPNRRGTPEHPDWRIVLKTRMQATATRATGLEKLAPASARKRAITGCTNR